MEQWKAIPGYEGLYEASNHGQIRTAEGKTTSSARFPHRVWKQRIMKQKYGMRKDGIHKDARVSLWKDGKEKTWLVARLVALAWCEGFHAGLTVNHIDGNPLNNNADNLEWVSLGDNIRHAFSTGLIQSNMPCTLINSSGEHESYASQTVASKAIGRSSSYIANCKIFGRPIKSLSGEVYELSVN